MTADNAPTLPAAPETGQARRALVTGATGYIGSQVTTELLERGWTVRTLSRSRDKALTMPWAGRVVPEGQAAGSGEVEVHVGDADSGEDLAAALTGIDVAWYLVHSMGTGKGFAEHEREMARTFARAAEQQRVGRIVYLGGLHPEGEELSEHLASRVTVGDVLLDSAVPTAALQAGVVLGAGSASFQMLRHLSERLPGAVAPQWVENRITPISVRDAVHYLVGAADLPAEVDRSFDIGGPDTLSYAEMMQRYAAAVDLPKRRVLTAPVTTPSLASQWIGLVTPVNAGLAEPLIGSLLNDTVLEERDLEDLVGRPPGGNQTFEEAVRTAVADGEHGEGLDTRRWRRVLLSSAAAVGACAAVGTILTDPSNRWYRSLRKPAWQPPAAAFPIVWTLLYADIAVISALVTADDLEAGNRKAVRNSAIALGTNLVLNAGWTGLFFRGKKPVLSTIEAAALALSSADLVRRAARSAPQRGVVLAPYAAWTGLAVALSASIARLNRGR
ncbi:tryptophan-rich sensory protein [uncultured Brevibacterium sp.]|uniref:tryptophan-rich sensory protein n=1 Tax=uncultured Brevibacterium sp. TaxID=189678 RepID=UPI0025F7CE2C|nr:tryptophan-rich sensory protein [uncultured Brevibacterium sp.]